MNKINLTRLKPILENWKFDFMAAIGVALIALPLALGLATASGAPPSAGVITSIVGGIVVAILGGGHVSIAGPGYGLIVVMLTSIISLGGNGAHMVAGFQYTLAAIIVAGCLMVLFGFLRLGILADLFPSSAIQGLLAGIGIIIIAQQFHIMFGIHFAKSEFNNYDLLMAIPNTLIQTFSLKSIGIEELHKMSDVELGIYAKELLVNDIDKLNRDLLIDKIIKYQFNIWVTIIGVISLIIMFAHSKIHLKVVHILPAPLWVVIIALGFHYLFKFIFGFDPIEAQCYIQLPDKLEESILHPDFGRILEKDSIIAIFSITIIGSLESLLSLKAVDKLDHFKRRSNANKDLKALGIASIFSGLIGGLPVVTVISRSSVNVNNGARTRASNLFKGLLLLAIILLCKPLLSMISYSALAGILVYTGYKLCQPTQFISIYKVGKEQLIIFIATFLATIYFNLLIGITAGIITTLLLQVIFSPHRRLFLREIFLPNTILFEESAGRYYVSVKWISNFLNYFILKKKLDTVPKKKHITLDFSLAKMVDTTVMEHMFYYQQDYEKSGSFEVIGLDIHQPASNHPFAVRHLDHSESEMQGIDTLSTHQKHMRQYMRTLNWEYHPEYVYGIKDLKNFPYFEYKNIDYAYNVCIGKIDQGHCQLFDIEYHEGEFIAKEDFKSTMIKIDIDFQIPNFTLDKLSRLEKLIHLGSDKGIELENHPDFSKRFKLKGRSPKSIRDFFNSELVLFFESNPYYHIESNGKSILIAKKEALASLSQIKALVSFSLRLIEKIKP